MKITKLCLKRYIRIRLNNIEYFEYTPTAPTQFIIGTNGSGKSSVLSELSPLPAEKSDYEKDGFKEISITYEGSHYVLKSDFGAEHVHSFLKDGKELNEGGTVTVQKELVKHHFHYTSEIHQMVTGGRRFHQMSLQERKGWFTMLSDANYDYAIGVFNRLKERLRDTNGALKLAKKRLVLEAAKVISDDDLRILKSSCESLYEQVQFLIENRMTVEKPASTLAGEYQRLLNELDNQTQAIAKKLKSLSRKFPMQVDDCRAKIAALQGSIAACHKLSEQYYEEHSAVQKLHEAWENSRLESLAEIDREITQCEKEVEEAQKASILKLPQEASSEVVLASCERILQWLPSVLDTLSDNRERQWGRTSYAALEKEIEELELKLQSQNRRLMQAETAISHQKLHQSEDDVTCPKCHHPFKLRFSAQVLEDAEIVAGDARVQIETLKTTLTGKFELRAQMTAFFQAYKHVSSTLEATPGFDAFTKKLVAENIILHNPSKLGLWVTHLQKDAALWATVEKAQERIDSAQKLLVQAKGNENASSHEIKARKENLEAKIARNEQEKRQYQLELEAVQRHIKDLLWIEEIAEVLKNLSMNLSLVSEEAVESLRREVYNEFLRDTQGLLANKVQALQTSERQLSVIESVGQEIEALMLDEAALKMIVKELSPTEGMIAEGLFGFMKTFVAEMNKHIKLIWTYPLTVKPCSLESEDSLSLTYRFPMDVSGTARKDVAEGSEGMKEVIDLAFRISAMKALHIGDFPLFLDEFGKALDPTHKQATIGLINAITELDAFEQIFFVSHDLATYGALGRAEICVMHEANVTIPAGSIFNKHVKME